MIRYLIKNNLKLMTRNGINFLLYVIGPLVVSAVLSSAFSSLLESYESADDFTAGYSIEEGSDMESYIDILKDVGEENGIRFREYDAGPVKETIEENGLGGFVEFAGDGYTVYKSADHKIEGSTLEYLMNAFFNAMISGDTEDIKIDVTHPDHAADIDSTDYYGIIYIVYFGWLGIVCAASLLSNEKKNRITDRLDVSDLSSLQVYLSRLIPLTISVCAGLGLSAVLSSCLLGVHWGNVAISSVIVFTLLLASSAFGLMMYELTQNMAATTFLVFGIVWPLGFIGGTFETYILSDLPQAVKQISPLYYDNRALVELSCMGASDYVSKAIIISLVIAAVSSVIAVGTSEIRRRVR